MADVFWFPSQSATPEADEVTIGSATAAQTFVVTVGGVKQESYTAGSGETTVTVAAALLAVLQASDEGEFTELTFEQGGTTSKIRVTGPADGRPFTLAVSGTGTISTTTLTSPKSPHDVADVKNYSAGALPSAADRLVLQDSDVGLLYNLDALTAIAVSFLRRDTFTGVVGLDPNNAGGYREYRKTHLELDAAAVTLECDGRESARQFRLKGTSGSACTLTVTGPAGGAQLGSEVVEVYGLVSTSVVNCTGGSVAVAPEVGQTAVVATLRAADATVHCGPGVTLTTATLAASQGRLDCSYTTLTMAGGSQAEARLAAAGTNTNPVTGRLVWKSTGSPGTCEVGAGGYMDFTRAPAGVAVSGTQKLHAGSSWDDRWGRVTTSYTVQCQDCDVTDLALLLLGPGKSLAIS